MKAISLHQPHPSLVSLGVQRFVTAKYPAEPGPIAIHAAQRKPDDGLNLGGYVVRRNMIGYDLWFPEPRPEDGISLDNGEWLAQPLPLGAVVGSGRITASYPIVEVGSLSDEQRPFVLSHPSGHLTWHADPPLSEFAKDLSDQLPYGDFTPGRYAWQIEDAAPTTERCPWCWGKAFLIGGPPVNPVVPCPVCGSYGKSTGRCDPVPATGKQRIWEWKP